MQVEQFKVGDTFTMDLPDRRWWIRTWCWILRRPPPIRRKAFKVTNITSAGGRVSVR